MIGAHGALSVRLIGASTTQPAFQRLQSVDLTKLVEYSTQDGDSLERVLEMHLTHLFDTNAELPLWGLTVLSDNTVVFFWQHCIGDGISGLAFHRTLIAALNADNTIYEGRELVDISPTTTMVPAIENVVSMRPSISQIYHTVIGLFLPVSWTSGRSAWTGKPVIGSNCSPRIRLLEFSPQDTIKFVAYCRNNRATLTPALHLLAVSALTQLLRAQTDSPSSQLWESISSLIPVSLRPIAHTSPDVMCNHVSQYHTYTTLTPEVCWSSAATLKATLHSFRAEAAGEVGMLRILCGQFGAFWKSKMGTKRELGLEVSNVGRFDLSGTAQDDAKKWHIDRMVFAQSNIVIGAAIKVNVCGNPLGGLAITVVWSSDSVEAALAEGFVSKLEQMFLEVISGEEP